MTVALPWKPTMSALQFQHGGLSTVAMMPL